MEKDGKMDKRKQPLAYLWAWCLCVLLFLLVGCGTQTPSLPTTPSLVASATVQYTADVVLSVVGTYRGTYQWHGSSSSSQMRLEITQEETQSLSGVCILGEQRSPLLNAMTTIAYGSGGDEGGIFFTVDVLSSQVKQAISLNFRGVVTKEGSMTGDVSASDGREGTWSLKKL